MTDDDDSTFYKNTWTVLDAYFLATPKHLARHHLDSFNAFLDTGIRNTIASMQMVTIKRKSALNDKDTRIQVFVGGRGATRLYLDRPTLLGDKDQARPLLPNEARLRGLTYASNLYADIEVEYTAEGVDIGKTEFLRVKIGSIPIMLHCSACTLQTLPDRSLAGVGECPNDQGGYFVVQGREKVVVAQELPPTNRLFFRKLNDFGRGNLTNVVTSAYIRCVKEDGSTFPKVVQIDVHHNGTITCNIPYLKTYRGSINTPADIPLLVLFRALGVESDHDVMHHILLGEDADPQIEAFLRPSILHAARDGIFDQRTAVEALIHGTTFKSFENLQIVLRDELFPNAGMDLPSKALMLGDLVRRLARVSVGAVPAPNRDHFSNRRFHVTGELFSSLFRDKYLLFQRKAMYMIDREWFYGPRLNLKTLVLLINDLNIKRMFQPDIIEDGIIASLKGAWNVDATADAGHELDNSIDGVAQDLNRVSYMAYVSHIRRLNHSLSGGAQAKQVEPHRLHPSQWGYICPIDSPDGPRIGLQKHLSVLTRITILESMKPLISHLLSTHLLLEISDFRGRLHELQGVSRVFGNELWLGVTFVPDRLTAYVRALRGYNVKGVGLTTSVAWHRYDAEVRLLSDAGRCCRPLFVIRDGVTDPTVAASKSRSWMQWTGPNDNEQARRLALHELPWKDLDLSGDSGTDAAWTSAMSWLQAAHRRADIELLDVEECSNCVIAMTAADVRKRVSTRFTHCEIHPAASLSAVSASFPLLHHQNGGYTYLALAQTKQAIGWYATTFASRMDTLAAVLHYSQLPVVTTGFANWLAGGRHAHGENLIVAIASFTGYNQDDGVLLNADSVARGMFHITTIKTRHYNEEDNVVFANPLTQEANGLAVDFSERFGSYDALDKDGFPVPGTHLHEDDMVIGLVSTSVVESVAEGGKDRVVGDRVRKEVRKDVSDQIGRGEGGIVEHVFVTGEAGARHAKVSLRTVRVPELGDKVASRFAQKGVVGMLLPACDMPFSHMSGLVPDVIFNPHAFPKRMTVAHLLEALLGKSATMAGTRVRADTFEPSNITGAASVLETEFGMNRVGDEIMYDGHSGEQITCAMFMGLNYVGRLKHLVVDKINFRATGPVAMLTHQATKGRKDKGGLRIGEMEVATLEAHGLSSSLKETLMDRADGSHNTGVDAAAFDVDARNGKPCLISNTPAGVFKCVDEDLGHRATSRVRIPFAAKLLIHELNSLAIDFRIHTDRSDSPDSTDVLDGDDVYSSDGDPSETDEA